MNVKTKKQYFIKKIKKRVWRRLSYKRENKRMVENVIWGTKDKEFIIVDGFLWHRCPAEPKFRSHNEYLHRYLWEKAYGAIPEGHKLGFKDGDESNYHLDNLYDVTLERWSHPTVRKTGKKRKPKPILIDDPKERVRERKRRAYARKKAQKEKIERIRKEDIEKYEQTSLAEMIQELNKLLA